MHHLGRNGNLAVQQYPPGIRDRRGVTSHGEAALPSSPARARHALAAHRRSHMVNDGWSVALAGRRKEMLEEAASMKTAGSALVVPTDVTDPAQVANLFAQTGGKFGRVDMLFNNAGGGTPTTNFGDFTYEMWLNVVQVNLNAMFLCAHAAFRMMRGQEPRGGRIINNGSISAHVPRPGSVAYTSPQARGHRADQVDRPGWAAIRHLLRADRQSAMRRPR